MAIVIDTSAVVAAYKNEADASRFWAIFESSEDLRLPSTCYVECVMVIKGASAREWLDKFVSAYEIAFTTCDATQARLAADAFERFGRGSGHPAKLNFGDCLAYASARALQAPLLFKGNDFAQTDIRSALT